MWDLTAGTCTLLENEVSFLDQLIILGFFLVHAHIFFGEYWIAKVHCVRSLLLKVHIYILICNWLIYIYIHIYI